jgi:PAS domain-containing protein
MGAPDHQARWWQETLQARGIGWGWIDLDGSIIHLDATARRLLDVSGVGDGSGRHLGELAPPLPESEALLARLREVAQAGGFHVPNVTYAFRDRSGAARRVRMDVNVVFHPAVIRPSVHVLLREGSRRVLPELEREALGRAETGGASLRSAG